MKTKFLLFLLLLIFVNIIVWFKSLSLQFYNDDFQILGYLHQNFLDNPFSIFTQKDVSNYYFRPIPNLINTSLLSLFGFNPLPFRLANFLLYLLSTIVLFLFLRKLFDNDAITFAFALLFSLLPSHDLFLVWIASAGDVLALLFILLSFYFLLFSRVKFALAIASIFFLLSILSKESTLLAPLFAFSLSFVFVEKKHLLRRFSFISLILLLLIFAYRFFVLQINIFDSPNVAEISLSKLLTNFFLYPFVLVVPTFAYSPENTLGILLNAILILLISSLLLIYFYKTEQKNTRNLLFGLFWYFWFVLPALPLFMRWYSLLPSLGLFFVFCELARNTKPKFFISFVVPISLIFFVVDYYSLSGWKKSNIVAHQILDSTSKIEPNQKRRILLWFFPQYYNNYPILRSGIQQAINFNRTSHFEEVLLPVSIVLTPRTSIVLAKQQSNEFTFQIEGAKVFLDNRNEKFEQGIQIRNDYYHLSIQQERNKPKYHIHIVFHRPKPEYTNFYFDGKYFKRMY